MLSGVPRIPSVVGRPLAPCVRFLRGALALPRYVADWHRYTQLPGAEPLHVRDSYACLTDRLPSTPYDPHYLQQGVWAGERIFASDATSHVDIGSQLLYVGMLAARMPVTFVDLRPLDLEIAGLRCMAGDILDLPFDDGSLQSVS